MNFVEVLEQRAFSDELGRCCSRFAVRSAGLTSVSCVAPHGDGYIRSTTQDGDVSRAV